VFLANMSHEIRTPMNSIMGFAELAFDKAASPVVKEYLSKITDSAKWLLRIINDILDISKIESGKIELEKVPFDLHSIFSRCKSVIHPVIADKGLDLRVNAEQPVGRKLLGDPVRLYQALMNLLSNAVKFTSSGTIRISSAIKGSDETTVTVYFEVKDSGIGMTPGQIGKVFEPFMQADTSTTRNYGGTGLGLAITKNIIELMGGKLVVESEYGVGSTFSFELTFDTVDSPDDEPEHGEITTIEQPCFDGLILVCEDNLMNQQVICAHLARVGLQSEIAENGIQCVEMVRERLEQGQQPYDMILMDIYMPVMDGVEAATKISALCLPTPIIAMTANVMTGELDNYRKAGMLDCVGKPFTTQELWRCLLKYLKPVSLSAIDESQRSRDDDGLQTKLRERFYKENQSGFAKIAGAVSAGDMPLAHRLTHTLKGNAGQIGMFSLQRAAADVESKLKAGNLPEQSQMETLGAELDAVIKELGTSNDAEESQNETFQQAGTVVHERTDFPGSTLRTDSKMHTDSRRTAKALLEKLEPMIENINPECVNLLDEIRAFPEMEELARQIDDYDFEAASRELAGLKKDWE